MDTDQTQATEKTRRKSAWALAGLSLSMLMPSLETSIANASLPTFAQVFDASFQDVQWIVLAYLLVITTMIVSVGRLGDLIGRRRLLLTGVVLFTLASLFCATASTLGILIMARVAQGLGASIMMALTLSFVSETAPKEKTGSAMGLLGTMSALGTTLGPSLGGLLLTGWGWPALFLINVPLGIFNLILLNRYLPRDQSLNKKSQTNFDVPGMMLLALTLAAYAMAMTKGPGAPKAFNISLLLLAGLGAALFIVHELKAKSPLIQLTMFRDSVLSAGLAMSALVSTVMMTTLVVGPFYLSLGLGLKAAWVGLALSAGPLVAAITGIPAGRIVDRWGAGRMTALGLSGMATGAFLLSLIPMDLGLFGYIAPIILMTSSYALFQAANNTHIMSGVQPAQRGLISGLLSLSRNLGLISGASAMGAIFAAATEATDLTRAEPSAVGSGMRFTFAIAACLITLALAITTVRRRLAQRDWAET